jgi:hypothetical protein
MESGRFHTYLRVGKTLQALVPVKFIFKLPARTPGPTPYLIVKMLRIAKFFSLLVLNFVHCMFLDTHSKRLAPTLRMLGCDLRPSYHFGIGDKDVSVWDCQVKRLHGQERNQLIVPLR